MANYLVRCKCPGKLGTVRLTEEQAHGWIEGEGPGYTAQMFSYSAYSRCWGCSYRFKLAVIRGKISTVHTCGAKCLASKGPTCECSCGGKNHGAGYI